MPPNLYSRIRQGLRYFYAETEIGDFSGGLNIRDAPDELAANESPDCLNVTLDERGGVTKRLGLTKYNAVQLNTAALQNLFYWATGQVMLAQQGDTVYKTTGDGTWSAGLKTFSTTDRVGFSDFAGKLIVIHPVDGAFSYDGASFSARITNSPVGNLICGWQNCLWTAGDPASPSRVTRSDIGAATWPVAGSLVFNDLRDGVEESAITALGAGQGFDEAIGKPALLAYKMRGVFRITDSSTGSYQRLHTEAGAAGPLATASRLGRVVSLNDRGVWSTDGVNPPVRISDRLAPLFSVDGLNIAQLGNVCGGVYRDRVLFSIPRAGSSLNNLTLEVHPTLGWIVPHSFAAAAFSEWKKQDSRCYSASTSAGYVYETFKGGTDDGVSFTGRYSTRWLRLAGTGESTLQRIRVSGSGTPTLYVKSDYQLGQGTMFSLALSGSASVWNTDAWGASLWGPLAYEEIDEQHPDVTARAVSLVFSDSSSSTRTGPQLLTDGTAPVVGAFAIYNILIGHTPLGRE